MGLFMDGDGMPLAFSMQEGNASEQTTLKPLKKYPFRFRALKIHRMHRRRTLVRSEQEINRQAQ